MKKNLNLILVIIALLGIAYYLMEGLFNTYYVKIESANSIGLRALDEALRQHESERFKMDSANAVNTLRAYLDTLKVDRVVYYGDVRVVDKIRRPQSRFLMDFKSDSTKLVAFLQHISNYPGEFYGGYKDKIKPTSFNTDSANIIKRFKERLDLYGLGYFKDSARLYFANSDKALVLFQERVLYYIQSALFPHPDKEWVGLYIPHRSGFARQSVFFRVAILLAFLSVLVYFVLGLIKTIKKQKYLADVRDDFIDSLTHEFKTPIATISAAIESMQSFNALENKDKAQRYLAMSKTELNRLNDMVTKLLAITTYDKNDFTLELQSVDMTAIVNEVLAIEKLRADKPVFFKVDIDKSANIINGDALHLKNVLINLIDNAIKYSKKYQVNISITGFKRKSTACFSIKDDGNGIPAHELDYIFDKFYRVPTNDKHLVKGTGLGLSYVRSVIEAHGGTIAVNSEINVQTEFIISIPLT